MSAAISQFNPVVTIAERRTPNIHCPRSRSGLAVEQAVFPVLARHQVPRLRPLITRGPDDGDGQLPPSPPAHVAQPQHRAAGLVQEQGSSTTSPNLGATTAGVSARLSTQPRPIQNLSSSSRAARRCGSLSDDGCGRAPPCHRMGSVLAVLARGGLFYEEGSRAVVPRTGYQGGDRGRRDSLAPLGRLSGHGLNTVRWRAGLRLALFFAGLGFAIWARVHLGRNTGIPMTQNDEPELVTSGPCHLVRHLIYSGILVAGVGTAVALSWLWLTAVALAGVYFVYSDRRGALLDRAVPRNLPGVQALDQDARAVHLLTGSAGFVPARTASERDVLADRRRRGHHRPGPRERRQRTRQSQGCSPGVMSRTTSGPRRVARPPSGAGPQPAGPERHRGGDRARHRRPSARPHRAAPAPGSYRRPPR